MHGPKGESYRPCEETREREPTVWFISLALRVEEPKKLTSAPRHAGIGCNREGRV